MYFLQRFNRYNQQMVWLGALGPGGLEYLAFPLWIRDCYFGVPRFESQKNRSKPRNVYNDQELALFTRWYSNLLDMILAYTPPKN